MFLHKHSSQDFVLVLVLIIATVGLVFGSSPLLADGSNGTQTAPFSPSVSVQTLRSNLRACKQRLASATQAAQYDSNLAKKADKNLQGQLVFEKTLAQRLRFEQGENKSYRRQLKQGKDHRGKPLNAAGVRSLEKTLADSDQVIKNRKAEIKMGKKEVARLRSELRKAKKKAAQTRRERHTVAGACDSLQSKLTKATSG